MTRYFGLLLCILLILVACEPEPTPLPASLPPTATPVINPTEPPPLSYALGANTVGFVGEIERLEAIAEIVLLSDSGNAGGLGTAYDIVAAYGLWPDWTASPITPSIALILNTQLAPLDNPVLADIVRQAVNTQSVVTALALPGAASLSQRSASPGTLKAQLANLGWPDGFELSLAAENIPGVSLVIDQLQAAGIEVQQIALPDDDTAAKRLSDNRLHLALVQWNNSDQRTTWLEQVGEENFIDLYTVPISYRALPDLTIGLTPGGWPLPAR